MPLLSELNELIANDKLGKAIDLLMEKTKNLDQDIYNTLILLKSRFTSNENENNMGTVSRNDYQRSKALITNSFQETMKRAPVNIIENNDSGNKNKKQENTSSEKEIEAYNVLLKKLNDKILYLKEELITTYDTEKKFALKDAVPYGSPLIPISQAFRILQKDLNSFLPFFRRLFRIDVNYNEVLNYILGDIQEN